MTDLSIFKYVDTDVRIVLIGGEPWFVAADLCIILGLTNPTMALRALEDDEKGLSQIETPGGRQNMAIVSESGMYALIMRSDKPNAKPFRRWITSEVIPALRKTGQYALLPATNAEEISTARATEISTKADETTAIIRMLGVGVDVGLLDKTWAIGKARLRAARAMGEEPELPAELAPLYVPDFLKGKSLKAKEINSVQSWFGRRCVEMGEANGLDVPQQRLTEQPNGTMRPTRAWQQRHLPLFEQVWDTYYAEKYAVPMVLELGGAA